MLFSHRGSLQFDVIRALWLARSTCYSRGMARSHIVLFSSSGSVVSFDLGVLLQLSDGTLYVLPSVVCAPEYGSTRYAETEVLRRPPAPYAGYYRRFVRLLLT